jgi:mycoredoxin
VEDRKFICPCYRHHDDIARDGHCICHLFVTEAYEPPEVVAPPPADEDPAWPRIEVYGAAWCRDTIRTRRLLNRYGVAYRYYDVDRLPEAAQRVRSWNGGFLSTPTLDIDGTVVTEPTDEALSERLGLS